MRRQLHPHNLRDVFHGRRHRHDRMENFLDERRNRGGFYGNNRRNEHEQEDARHERLAQQLRDATPKLFMDYLNTLCTNLDSITAELQDLDLKDGEYQARSAYKYGRPAMPSFSGSDAAFIDFVRECIAYCRVKKMPNQLQDYLFKRLYAPNWTEEMVISDRELYGML